MTSRFPLLALALALPFAACESEPETVETDIVDVETVDPMDDPMADPMMDDTAMDDMDAPAVTAQGTVDAVTNSGGLTSLPAAAAVDNINGWIAQLEGNPDFAPVVSDLETLRGQLQASPIDGAAVGATLQRLGEATTGAAGGDSALQTLGTTLTEAGNQLSGM